MEWKSRDDLISDIPKRSIPTYDHLSYDQFLSKHLIPNTPFLLSSSTTSAWPSRQHWSSPSNAGPSRPNFAALRPYGDQVVPVADTTIPQWGEFERSDRPLREVLDLWERGEGEGLYVKDWHLIAEITEKGEWEGEIYEVPDCFRDDWLNPPFRPAPPSPSAGNIPKASEGRVSTSDFRFTYLGPPGTFTPLHRDVYASYSWSANVVGRKVWWLFPPDRLEGVRDKAGNLVFDVREVEGEGGAIKILQDEGEIIFVPSGWHHQVVNIDFCISINHNFFSAITLPRIFAALEEAQERVEHSIADVKAMIQDRLRGAPEVDDVSAWEKEWVDEVQGLLERDAGWAWRGLWETLLRNIQIPSAPADQRPPDTLRDERVREIAHSFRSKREYVVLQDLKDTIDQIEQLLAPSSHA